MMTALKWLLLRKTPQCVRNQRSRPAVGVYFWLASIYFWAAGRNGTVAATGCWRQERAGTLQVATTHRMMYDQPPGQTEEGG